MDNFLSVMRFRSSSMRSNHGDILVFADGRVLRVRIVVNCRVGRYLAQSGVLELAQHVLALFGVFGRRTGQEHDERGRLRFFGHVYYFFESGHAEGHVFGRHTGMVKRVQGHLGGGLAERLGGQWTDHFAGLHLGLLEPGLNFA
ncbi:hypothetical protein BpHYR1_033065 [Brachionus plicatilis]|uniref:Uncharacterized protein n=1 Tax=Brachionus plicatilis TaxID=10195 RepID=A0A3M7RI55_BRAPC|nr:hypothetical protein BpHYR1_033065 [Brachionus plicatilis]